MDLADQLAGNGQRLPRGRLGRTRCRGRVLKRSHLDGFGGVGGGDLGLVVPHDVPVLRHVRALLLHLLVGRAVPGCDLGPQVVHVLARDHSASGPPRGPHDGQDDGGGLRSKSVDSVGPCRALACSVYCVRPPRAQLRRVAPVGGQRSAFEDGASGPDQAGDRRDALSQGGRAVRPRESQVRELSSSTSRSCSAAASDGDGVIVHTRSGVDGRPHIRTQGPHRGGSIRPLGAYDRVEGLEGYRARSRPSSSPPSSLLGVGLLGVRRNSNRLFARATAFVNSPFSGVKAFSASSSA